MKMTDKVKRIRKAARKRTRRDRSRPKPRPECFGCGFAHATEYADCVWLKGT